MDTEQWPRPHRGRWTRLGGIHQNNRFTMVVTLISHIRDQNDQVFQIEVLFYAYINSYFISC